MSSKRLLNFRGHKSAEPQFHKISLDELELRLNTSLKFGMDDTKASKLRLKRGDNRITSATRNIFFSIVGYFVRGFCALLWVVAVLNILNYTTFVIGTADLGL